VRPIQAATWRLFVQLTDQFRKFIASHFWLDQRRLAVIINAMHGKDVLRQIDSDSDNSSSTSPFVVLM
jgi:hypothetical protein